MDRRVGRSPQRNMARPERQIEGQMTTKSGLLKAELQCQIIEIDMEFCHQYR